MTNNETYRLEHTYNDRVTIMTFSDASLETLKENLTDFLRSTGWHEDTIKVLFNEEEADCKSCKKLKQEVEILKCAAKAAVISICAKRYKSAVEHLKEAIDSCERTNQKNT